MHRIIGALLATLLAVAAAGCAGGMKDDGMMKDEGMMKSDRMKKDSMMK